MNDTTDTEAVTASQLRHLFEEQIGATKDHELWSALDRLINAAEDERDDSNDQKVAELCLHFPGLTSVMLLAWQHITRIDAVTPCSVCEPSA